MRHEMMHMVRKYRICGRGFKAAHECEDEGLVEMIKRWIATKLSDRQ